MIEVNFMFGANRAPSHKTGPGRRSWLTGTGRSSSVPALMPEVLTRQLRRAADRAVAKVIRHAIWRRKMGAQAA